MERLIMNLLTKFEDRRQKHAKKALEQKREPAEIAIIRCRTN